MGRNIFKTADNEGRNIVRNLAFQLLRAGLDVRPHRNCFTKFDDTTEINNSALCQEFTRHRITVSKGLFESKQQTSSISEFHCP